MDPQEAIDYIRSLSPGAISAPRQVEYLKNPEFPKNPKEASQPPPIPLTSQDAECYQSRAQTTGRSLQLLLHRTAGQLDSGEGKVVNFRGGGVYFIGTCE